jgi:hypothetical protein
MIADQERKDIVDAEVYSNGVEVLVLAFWARTLPRLPFLVALAFLAVRCFQRQAGRTS